MVTFWKRNTSRRKDVQNCAAWSLEDLINKVITKVNLSQSSANEMLWAMFYKVSDGIPELVLDIKSYVIRNRMDAFSQLSCFLTICAKISAPGPQTNCTSDAGEIFGSCVNTFFVFVNIQFGFLILFCELWCFATWFTWWTLIIKTYLVLRDLNHERSGKTHDQTVIP